MVSNTSEPSPIDLAVYALTTFSGFKAPTEDWHSQFAADIGSEELPRSKQPSSMHESSNHDVVIPQPQSEEQGIQQDLKVPENMPSAGPSTLTNQQPLPKFTPLVRPSSSHKDIAATFAFGKPQPKQLDFSRKRNQDPSLSMSVTLPRPDSNIATSPETRASPINNLKVTDVAETRDVVPILAEATSLSPSETASPTLVASVLDMGSPTAHAESSITSQDLMGPGATASNLQGETVRHTDIPAVVTTQQASPRNPAKVAKLQRKSKPKADPNAVGTSQPAGVQATLSYEDTLSVLLIRYRKEQLEREEARAAAKAKDIELQDLREISNVIYTQLQQVQQREKSQKVELSRFHRILPQWENRVKKLTDYVQSLIDDHQTLRDNAEDIDKQQKTLQADRSEIASALKGAHQKVENDHSKTKKVLVEARHHMEMLEQTVSNQETQLRDDADLLNVERARSQRLEDEMSKIGINHQHLLELMTEHRSATTEKLDGLLSKSQEINTITPPPSQDYVKPILSEVVSLLKELRETEVIKPDDLHKLDASVKCYVERLTGSLRACEQTVAHTGASQKAFASDFRDRLQALSASITTEHAFIERVMDLNEMKATLRERVQASETALVEARQQSITLENNEQTQLQRISALETEAANLRRQLEESPQARFRVHELESQKKDLQERNNDLQKEAAGISGQLQQKIEDAAEAENRLNNLDSQLQDANAVKSAFEDQKLAFESQSNAKLEQTKKELWIAANREKVKLESIYQNQLHQLKQQKIEVDAKLEQEARQLIRLRDEKEAAEAKACLTSSLLMNLQAEQESKNGASSVLQSRVNQLETANDEIEKQLVQLKEILKAATETRDAQVQKYGQVVEKLRFITSELEAKDAQVQLLTASNTLSFAADSLQPSNSKDQEHPKRNANRAEKRLPTVAEDSQPNDVPPSTVAKPGSTKGIEMSTPSRHHQDQLIGRSHMSSPLEGFDDMLDDLGDLAELCSPLPTSASQKQGSARTITTQYTDILVGKGSQEVSPPSRLTVSYDSRSTAHRSIHFSHPSDTPIFPGTSSVSQADRTDLSTHGSKYDKQKSPRQKASPKQSSRRRGILKESTAEKRPVSTAGLAPADPHRTSKRVKDLGPVIPDNQSPQGSRIPARNHRPAKMNSRKQPRDDKYSRRFSRELQ